MENGYKKTSIDLMGQGGGDRIYKDPPPISSAGAVVVPGEVKKLDMPSYGELKTGLAEANLLVDDIILKNYLTKLTDLEVVPLDEKWRKIEDIRLFKITEMIYQKDEYSTYKFASVFNAVQGLDCGVFIVADSNGDKTEFYMGVRSMDDKHTTSSLKNTLLNALRGQFPGVKTADFMNEATEQLIGTIPTKNIAAVSCVSNNKDEEFNNNEKFIQGLEKLALAMQGQRYTAVVLAKSTSAADLSAIRKAYEDVFTGLSPFANLQISNATNEGFSLSDAFSYGKSATNTYGTSISDSTTSNTTTNESKSTNSAPQNTLSNVMGTVSSIGGTVAGALLIAGTGGAAAPAVAPLIAAGLTATGAGLIGAVSRDNSSTSSTFGTSTSTGTSHSVSVNESKADTQTENYTYTKGLTGGSSESLQLTVQNKTLISTLERIDAQLKRIEDCESLGMWECAAYFLSDSQETAEMAAGTYKALMRGEKSGVETSAINLWNAHNGRLKLPILRDYITNFLHPTFNYNAQMPIPVTAGALVSGNELALHMGLPRKSVNGFPVIEHADFGKEVIKYGKKRAAARLLSLGKIFAMGESGSTDVKIDADSLTMHTFITGSTGSGKSNTVYQLLNKLRAEDVPFLVIEPAKGEYKDIFGNMKDVSVYGTNPRLMELLRINPFSFPPEVHILEHLDRLVEIFNVCWPMYAAMPAILKEGMENAYKATGWDLVSSENYSPRTDDIFPNFVEISAQIERIISGSRYSAEVQGNYAGALLTRINSLTTGLNQLIFTTDGISDAALFDENTIIDLSRVGSSETKSLIMGLLLMKLGEYRLTSGKRNSPLSHITVLEEAHNILKRTSTEQAAEGSNLIGKSVEMLANSIAEMRTYGEGFVIADQSPGLLDMSAIRNTNTKIILRLPEKSDRELVGYAANLNDEQITELAKLETGVAAIYQNDWVEPVLVKMEEWKTDGEPFKPKKSEPFNERLIQRQIIHMMIQGRVSEKLEFDPTEIRQSLRRMNLTVKQKEFIEGFIMEYEETQKISIWKDEKFSQLAEYLALSAQLTENVEEVILTSADNAEITARLAFLVGQKLPGFSEDVIAVLVHCLMEHFSLGKDEPQKRFEIYEMWKTERGVQ
ncbi:MAG: ATP-binding protein [Defluviitaleaceae bacterium]|nr:ATP-binding protein [Defluviitaleaceae bacterium]